MVINGASLAHPLLPRLLGTLVEGGGTRGMLLVLPLLLSLQVVHAMPAGSGERMLQPALAALPAGPLFYHSKPQKLMLTQALCSLKWQDSLLEIKKQPLGHGACMFFGRLHHYRPLPPVRGLEQDKAMHS